MMLKLRYIGSVPPVYRSEMDRLLSACDWSPKVAETGIVVLDEVFHFLTGFILGG